ncbi:MAG: hypothetical protein IJ859_03500 [Synergistaceae bacterium]|nr:hypothetical protein [Synergistaceae bacterium]
MAWLEAHQELPRHPKTKRFARMLKISIPQAVGHLFLLWWWALDYAENGDLSKYDAYDLADAVQWDGDPEEFLSAMIDCGPGGTCGFIEKDESGNIFIHDWDKYSGRLVEKREKNRKRKAQERKNNSTKISAKKDENSSKVRAEKSESNEVSNLVNTEENQNKKIVADLSRATDGGVAGLSQGYRTQQNTTETEQNKTVHNSSSPAQPAPKKFAAAAEAEKEKINLGEIVSLWNTRLAPLGFAKVLKQTLPREKALEALLNSSPDRNKFRWWQEIFDRISASEFLRKSIQERNWFTLDWLLNEHNLVKILEGRYDNRVSKQKAQQAAQSEPRASSIEEILAKHRAKNSNAIDAEYNVVGEGEAGDGERSPGFR